MSSIAMTCSRLLLCALMPLLSACTSFESVPRLENVPATDGTTTLVIEPLRGTAGQYVQTRGSGWPPNELVLIHLQDDRGRSGILATDLSDTDGTFTTGFTWPISERWLQEGAQTVLARTQDDSTSTTAIFLIEEGLTTERLPVGTSNPVDTPLPASPQSALNTTNVTAFRLDSPPVIDGTLDEWTAVQSYRSPHIAEADPAWDGSIDVDGIWFIGWDESALYVAVRVSDDRHVQENSAQFAYYGDSIEIQLDTDRTGDLGPTVDQDDYQYVVTPGDFAGNPAAAWRFRGDDSGLLSDAPGSGIRVASQPREDGYTLEFAIPWSDLNLIPGSGLSLGATLDLNDNDVPGSIQTQFLMLSNVPGRLWRVPDTWGTLTLE